MVILKVPTSAKKNQSHPTPILKHLQKVHNLYCLVFKQNYLKITLHDHMITPNEYF